MQAQSLAALIGERVAVIVVEIARALRSLRAERVDVDLRSPADLPRNLAELQNYDSVVLSNVGAWELSPDQMKMIQSNVRDLGAGLVMIGGEHSFGVFLRSVLQARLQLFTRIARRNL